MVVEAAGRMVVAPTANREHDLYKPPDLGEADRQFVRLVPIHAVEQVTKELR